MQTHAKVGFAKPLDESIVMIFSLPVVGRWHTAILNTSA
jgi:hypothetical protein